MEFLKYLFIVILAVTSVTLLITALYSKSFFKTLLLNATTGILAVAVINLTTRYTGVHIPVNPYSASCCGILGLPGVCGLLAANFIFI